MYFCMGKVRNARQKKTYKRWPPVMMMMMMMMMRQEGKKKKKKEKKEKKKKKKKARTHGCESPSCAGVI